MSRWILTREVIETIEVEGDDEDAAELAGDEIGIDQWVRDIVSLEVREL